MQNLMKYSIIAILTFSVVAGIFNNIPTYAQGGNQTTTTPMANMTHTEGETGEAHTTQDAQHSPEGENKHTEANTVRDSVTVLLQDNIIPTGDFIHLYDSTPYHIMNGHV